MKIKNILLICSIMSLCSSLSCAQPKPESLDSLFKQLDELSKITPYKSKGNDRIFTSGSPEMNPLQRQMLIQSDCDYFGFVQRFEYMEASLFVHDFLYTNVTDVVSNEINCCLITLIEISPMTKRLFRSMDEAPNNYTIKWDIDRYDAFISKKTALEIYDRIKPLLNKQRDKFNFDTDYQGTSDRMYYCTPAEDGTLLWRKSTAPFSGESEYLFSLGSALRDYVKNYKYRQDLTNFLSSHDVKLHNKLKQNNSNQELQPTVKTPVESGNEQGTAAEL